MYFYIIGTSWIHIVAQLCDLSVSIKTVSRERSSRIRFLRFFSKSKKRDFLLYVFWSVMSKNVKT